MQRQEKVPKKIILGLTGSFGSGKTTVAGVFAALGAGLLDADRISHRLLKERGAIYKKIVLEFGSKILKENKEIERNKLANIVFSKRRALKRLNSILHPEIIRRLKRGIAGSRRKIVILDAPLLLEAGLKGLVDKIVVVDISRRKQIARLKKRRSLSERDILSRLKSQWPLRKKKSLADFIIDNNGSRSKTREQTVKIWKQLSIIADKRACRRLGGTRHAKKRGSSRRQLWKNWI
jgi:dephospho-CoA kinase